MNWTNMTGSFPTRRIARMAAALGVICSIAVSAAACTGESDVVRSAGVASGSESFAQLFEGYSANYVAAESPRELAEMSSVVVTGRISRIVEGQSTKPVDEASTPVEMVLMVVAVDEVHAGALPTDSTAEVFVELPAPYGIDAPAFDQSAPKDETVLLFLVPSPGLEKGYEVVDQGEEWPGADVVMDPTSPQGFLIAEGENQVLYPLDHELTEGVSLGQFLPNNDKFPVGSRN